MRFLVSDFWFKETKTQEEPVMNAAQSMDIAHISFLILPALCSHIK